MLLTAELEIKYSGNKISIIIYGYNEIYQIELFIFVWEIIIGFIY